MLYIEKIKQFNIFQQVSKLNIMITKQPIDFINILANNNLPDAINIFNSGII
ncbi:hypothetical protein [Clostridium sp. ZS2-4]|uniref:hypothetical protein n=1 Tax=Clostridium sp. ZS2-4 TaxID=2987703 RepID=UPI00227C1137|nr:hypothetical protein [Clostridium sp. ZS2-4]MCY6356622.1 hypothetical protein [Clostridium sp. ZS2-4]